MSSATRGLTPGQASIFAAVSHYHDALGEPVPAAYVARRLGLTRQRVAEYFRALNRLGWLRGESSPAIPTRELPGHDPLTKRQLSGGAEIPDSRGVSSRPAPAADPGAPRMVDFAPLAIRAAVTPDTINEAERSVELVFSTGAAVPRYDWMSDQRYVETLSLDPAHVRIDRLNDGAPLLDSHSAYSLADQLGTVVPGSVRLTKTEGRVRVRFSKRAAVEPVWGDVRDGIIRSVSVGYRVHKYEETVANGNGNALPVRKAVDWEPYEVSLVTMPADAGAKVRGELSVATNPCEIVIRAADPVAPKEEPQPMKENRAPEFVAEVPVIPAAVPAAPAAPAKPTEGDAARAQERARCQGITLACRAARLPQSKADELIASGMSLEAAQTKVLEELAARGGAEDVGPSSIPSGGGGVAVGEDPIVHARAGIVNALLHRVSPERFKLEEIGRPYRGMSVLDIGRAFLNARGVRTSRMDRSALVDAMLTRTGMHTTSDFPLLFEDAANKNLRAAYEAAPQTWRPLAKPVMLSDFKPSRQLQVGDAPELEEILEHGEYKHGTIAEAKEQVQLKTYGKMFAITRQALINDDLNAFGEVPAAFGRKAADKESDLAWAEIISNPVMGDGVVLFHADHANLTTPGTAISVDSLGVARAALRLQTGIDGETLLNLAARYLIVPAAKETKADQMVSTQLVANVSGSINPFAGRLQVIAEPRLDASSGIAWYVATDVAQAPVLFYGTLDGQGGPLVTQQEGFDVDGMKFRCRIDVALKAADFRAIYKNLGA